MGENAVHCLDLLGLNRITILELKAFAEAQMVQTAQTLDFEVGFQVISNRLGRLVAQHLKEIGDSSEFRVPAGTVDADLLPFPSQGPFDELNQVGDCIRFTQVVVKLDNIVMLVLIRCPDKAKVYSTVFRLPCQNFNPEPVVVIVTSASRQEEDGLFQACLHELEDFLQDGPFCLRVNFAAWQVAAWQFQFHSLCLCEPDK